MEKMLQAFGIKVEKVEVAPNFDELTQDNNVVLLFYHDQITYYTISKDWDIFIFRYELDHNQNNVTVTNEASDFITAIEDAFEAGQLFKQVDAVLKDNIELHKNLIVAELYEWSETFDGERDDEGEITNVPQDFLIGLADRLLNGNCTEQDYKEIHLHIQQINYNETRIPV